MTAQTPDERLRIAITADRITSNDSAMRGMLAVARESIENIALGSVSHEPDADLREAVAAIVAQAIAERLGDDVRDGECETCGRSTDHPNLTLCIRHRVDTLARG